MTKRNHPGLSDWQRQLLRELKALARDHPAELRVTQGAQLDSASDAVLRISLHTADIRRIAGGLPLLDDEEFILRIRPSLLLSPVVEVDHVRFLGCPHVLQGQRLCIFLDPSREWQPSLGMAGFLNRIWDWLTDAAAGTFDASTAMYHAVGGVLHRADGTPTLVVREQSSQKRYQTGRLIARSPHRSDLTHSRDHDGHHVPVITLATDLPFGAAATLPHLLALLDDPYLDRAAGRPPRVLPQSPAFLSMLLACAARNPDNTEQYFVLAVPHPAGGPAHLLGGRLPMGAANTLRRIAKERGTTVAIDRTTINPQTRVEWCNMSDERQSVTTRRDERRPVNGFRGKTVQVWGCGGLGSWAAEFIARAGAAAITVCDPGIITGGLLVRQNYVEGDIGLTKAHALATRLQAIRDDLTVTVATGSIPDDATSFLAADLILDATVSNAVTTLLDNLSAVPQRRALIAQVASDANSGTLGIANLCPPNANLRPSDIDQRAGKVVTTNSELELYHPLWQEVADGDELIPTRGCSIPTFHGSAADLSAVAAILVSLIGAHIQHAEPNTPGTELIALPHAASGPRHHFIPAGTDGAGC